MLKNLGFSSPSWEDLAYVLLGLLVVARSLGATLWETHRHDRLRLLLVQPAGCKSRCGCGVSMPPRQLARRARHPGDRAGRADGCCVRGGCAMRGTAVLWYSARLATLQREFNQLVMAPRDTCVFAFCSCHFLIAAHAASMGLQPKKAKSKATCSRHHPSGQHRHRLRQLPRGDARPMTLPPGATWDPAWCATPLGEGTCSVARLDAAARQRVCQELACTAAVSLTGAHRRGRALLAGEPRDAWRAEREYGVPAEIIVGIIGVGDDLRPADGHFRVIDALATLAFDFPSHPRGRAQRVLRGELEQFLTLQSRIAPTCCSARS